MTKNTSPSNYFSTTSRARLGSDSPKMVSMWLPDELIKRLASEVGNKAGLSMSDTIRTVLEDGLAVRNSKNKLKEKNGR